MAPKQSMIDFARDFDNLYHDLKDDMQLLGLIRLDDRSLLRFDDFCRIQMLIKKYTHPVMVPSLKVLIDLRRIELENNNEEQYRKWALEYKECEENFRQRISDVVMEHFGIEQVVFFESY